MGTSKISYSTSKILYKYASYAFQVDLKMWILKVLPVSPNLGNKALSNMELHRTQKSLNTTV